MPNTNPYITRTREEPLPYLGLPWEVATQAEDSSTGIIQSRVFNVLGFGTPEVELVNNKPPDYPDNDVTAYYRVSRPMTQTQWVGLKEYTSDPNHPMYPLNNFQGWLATPYEFALETWYLDLLYRKVTWQPKLEDWVDPSTFFTSPAPTSEYELLIKDASNNLISSAVQSAEVTELVLALDSNSWGINVSLLTGGAYAYLAVNELDTTTSYPVTITKQVISQSHLRLIKPSAVYTLGSASIPPSLSDLSSITLHIYGVAWFGDVRFLDEIGETTVHMHPEGTDAATLLKPPGLSHLSTQYNALSHLGEGTPVTQTRPGSIVILP